jgi:hypothetical protein
VNSERYISFEFNGFRFIDSFQFLPSSLDKLVANCALDGYDKFVYMQRWLSDSSDIFVNDNSNENDNDMASVHDNENEYILAERKLNNKEKDCRRTE